MARWRAMMARADSTMSTVAASLRSAPAQKTGCDERSSTPCSDSSAPASARCCGELGDEPAGEGVAVGGGVEGEHRDAVVVGPVHQCVAHGADPSHCVPLLGLGAQVVARAASLGTGLGSGGGQAAVTRKTGIPGATAAISGVGGLLGRQALDEAADLPAPTARGRPAAPAPGRSAGSSASSTSSMREPSRSSAGAGGPRVAHPLGVAARGDEVALAVELEQVDRTLRARLART